MIISWSFRNYIEICWKASSHAFSNPPETKISDKETEFDQQSRKAGGGWWATMGPRAGAGSGDRCFVFTEDCEDTLLTWSLVTYNLQPPTH